MRIFRIGSLLALAAFLVLGGPRTTTAAPVDWGDVLGGKSPSADKHSPTAKPAATHTIVPLATVGPTRTAATQTPAATTTHAATATRAATKAPSPPRARKPAPAPPPKPAKPARRPTLQSEFPSAGR